MRQIRPKLARPENFADRGSKFFLWLTRNEDNACFSTINNGFNSGYCFIQAIVLSELGAGFCTVISTETPLSNLHFITGV